MIRGIREADPTTGGRDEPVRPFHEKEHREMSDPNQLHAASNCTRAELQSLAATAPTAGGKAWAKQALAELDGKAPAAAAATVKPAAAARPQASTPAPRHTAKTLDSIRQDAFASMAAAENPDKGKEAEEEGDAKGKKDEKQQAITGAVRTNAYGFPIPG